MVKNFSDDFGILWVVVQVNYSEAGDVLPKRCLPFIYLNEHTAL
jgi:hypothetical protein